MGTGRGEIAFFGQFRNHAARGAFGRLLVPAGNHIRHRRRLVRSLKTRHGVGGIRSRSPVYAFRISGRADLQRRVHIDLKELWDLLPGYLIFRSIIPDRPPTRRTVQALVDGFLIPGLTRTSG